MLWTPSQVAIHGRYRIEHTRVGPSTGYGVGSNERRNRNYYMQWMTLCHYSRVSPFLFPYTYTYDNVSHTSIFPITSRVDTSSPNWLPHASNPLANQQMTSTHHDSNQHSWSSETHHRGSLPPMSRFKTSTCAWLGLFPNHLGWEEQIATMGSPGSGNGRVCRLPLRRGGMGAP
jgi:hypothetical protein